MKFVFVVQEKNINTVMVFYKKKINIEIKNKKNTDKLIYLNF